MFSGATFVILQFTTSFPIGNRKSLVWFCRENSCMYYRLFSVWEWWRSKQRFPSFI